MHVISRKALQLFWEKYTDSEDSLRLWYTRAKNAEWQSLQEIKQTYPSADLVGQLTVFNIKGNAYRLIVRIEYERNEIYIRHILTHEEYSKNHWKKNNDWL